MPRSKKKPASCKNTGEGTPRSADTQPCLIVGIGASAGGLKAFKAFFSSMPIDTCMAFVVVPHLDPTHQSLIHELLAMETRMPVCEADDGMTVERDHVYIIPPARYLTIDNGTLHLTAPQEPRWTQTAIDHFLRSLARDQQERSVGIILSGTGSHGTPGLKEIKLVGGMVMVQQPQSAEYDQMPRSAIATGVADYVLPPEQMPEALVKYASHPYLRGQQPAGAATGEASEYLARILALLHSRSRHDFRSYHKNMLMRRVQRRMGLCHIEKFPDYLDYLGKNAAEVTALIKDLLIGVTGFFREPGAFEVLAKQVIPDLVAGSGATTDAGRPVRIWVPGCTTGEEAYSLAILFSEQFDAMNRPANIQIFASDIDEESVSIARLGIYPASDMADIPAQRLQRFFVKIDEHHYQVTRQLRECIVFAPQNLISDAPFSKLDLVSCRNLLIYLEPEVQQKVIALFHYALNEDGYLLLGPSESIGAAADMFEPVSKKWRVYRRIGPVRAERVSIPVVTAGERRIQPGSREATTHRPPDFSRLMQRLVLEELAPASVLVTRTYAILGFLGPTVNYLEFPPGEPTLNLMSLVRPGLQTRLRVACRKAIHEDHTVTDAEALVKRNGSYVPCTITVRPLAEPKEAEGLLLVTFQDRPGQAALNREEQTETGTAGEAGLVQQLEYELKASHDDLQSTIEELESSNEELKASNEEVMSMNEELQSANEELVTLNQQFQQKVDELEQRISERTAKLQRSEQEFHTLADNVPALLSYLDADQRYRYVNHRYEEHWKRPMAEIIGRTAEELLGPAGYATARPYIEAVLAGQAVTYEAEFGYADGPRTMQVRLVPDIGATGQVQGFFTLVNDITELKQAESAILEREDRLRIILDTAPDAIITIESEGKIVGFNQAAEAIFGYSASEAIGQNVSLLMPSPYREEHDDYLARHLETHESSIFCKRRELPGRRKDGSAFPLELTVSEIARSGLFVGIIRDISAQRELEKEVINASTFEQERIGQEIHDGLGQRLTGLSMMVESLRRALTKRALPEAATAGEIIKQLQEATRESRAIAQGLIPVPLTEQGLSDALGKLAKDIQAATGINCSFTTGVSDRVEVKDRAIAVQLYRIAQEVVHNAVRHAQARNIAISLSRTNSSLELLISDDGKGFRPDSGTGAGFGLRIMHYRAAMIGCDLKIDSSPGKGTVVRCRLYAA
jgi:two-component system CheB/CheR fusion protein